MTRVAPSRSISFLPETTPFKGYAHYASVLRLSRGVDFSTANRFTYILLTFLAYVFTSYPIDGKPAISSVKELFLFLFANIQTFFEFPKLFSFVDQICFCFTELFPLCGFFEFRYFAISLQIYELFFEKQQKFSKISAFCSKSVLISKSSTGEFAIVFNFANIHIFF